MEEVEPRLLFSTFIVNTNSDAPNPGSGLTTLRQAVAEAATHAGANTISFHPKVFSPGALHTITLTQGEINLADTKGTTTINGPGSAVLAVDAANLSRVFVIDDNVSVSINGLAIVNGSVNDSTDALPVGGGIFNSGSLVLANDLVANNSTYTGDLSSAVIASGGGIYSTGPLTISNSVVKGNSAFGNNDQDPGAEGGAVYASEAFNAISSTFSNNLAFVDKFQEAAPSSSVYGGALYLTANAAITDCTLSGNYASGIDFISFGLDTLGSAWGGAVFSTGSLNVTSSLLTNNVATGGSQSQNSPGGKGYGGGIASIGALSISSSTISFNAAQGGTGPGGDLSVQASAFGGGVYSTEALNVVDSTISGNAVQGASFAGTGGAAEGGGIDALGVTNIISSSVLNNDADGGEGGEFDGSLAGQGGVAWGGGVFDSDLLNVLNSTIANNHANAGAGGSDGSYDAPIDPDAITGNGGNAAGGGIFDNGQLILNDSTISGNSSVGGVAGYAYSETSRVGTAGVASSGGIDIYSGSALLNNSVISGNTDSGSTSDDILGTAYFTSSNNLIGVGGELTNGFDGNIVGVVNPDLSPLGNYGGATDTMVPLAGSPAIGAGDKSLIPAGVATDQRGFATVTNGSLDIGATQFGNATITGQVFNDEYASGVLQKGDLGLSGWTVYLDLNHDGAFDAGDISSVTNSNGVYSFIDVTQGTYAVNIVPQRTYRLTSPIAVPTTVSLKIGATVSELNFAETQDALISGTVVSSTTHKPLSGFRVYLDLNYDGKWEVTEPSIATGSNGTWSFNIASPGSYRIRIVGKPGYKTTAPSGGAFTFDVGKASTRIANVFSEAPTS